MNLRRSFASAIVALALFGLGRFVFNLVAVRVFGPIFVGDVNVRLSSVTIIAVLLGTIPAFVTSRYAPEYLARNDRDRARRVFSASIAVSAILGAVVAAVLAMTSANAWGRAWLCYVPIFSTYLVAKAGAFAFQTETSYVRAECLGFVAFVVVCAAGCTTGSGMLATWSLVAQPAVAALISLSGMIGEIARSGVLHEVRRGSREYFLFSGATFINAVTGLATYHFVVVVAGWVLPDRSAVGYLSVMLSSLAPLNLVPTALGTTLFPEIARLHGSRNTDALRRIVSRGTVGLQSLVVGGGTTLLLFPGPFLHLMRVPDDPALRSTWVWLAWALQSTIVSSPCGHFLNATGRAVSQAMASLVFLAFGTGIGVIGLVSVGIVGAGWMRAGLEGGLSWTRMILVERALGWTRDAKSSAITAQIIFALALLMGLSGVPVGWRVAIWVVAGASQIRVLRREVAALSEI
jgi:O-antigen/teichoic acid export membrane protein